VELDDDVLPVVFAAPPVVPAALPVVLVVPLVLPDAVPDVVLRVPPDVPDWALSVALLPVFELPPVVLEAEPCVAPLEEPEVPEPPIVEPEEEPDDPPGVITEEPPEEPPAAPPEPPPLAPPPVWAMAATLRERAAAATVAIKVVRIEKSPVKRVPAWALVWPDNGMILEVFRADYFQHATYSFHSSI